MNLNIKIIRYFIFICVINFTVLNIGFCLAQLSEEADNVETIENGERGLWSRDDSKQLRIEEIQSIGVYEGDDNYIFANIHDVAITPNGNLYICDWGDKCIKVYDKNGVFIRKLSTNLFTNVFSLLLLNSQAWNFARNTREILSLTPMFKHNPSTSLSSGRYPIPNRIAS